MISAMLRSLAAMLCLTMLACPRPKPGDGPNEVPKQNPPPEEEDEDPDFEARKPSWWPEPNDRNLHWPPPRPDDWPEGDAWPPLREQGEAPDLWADAYGEDVADEELDDPPEGEGEPEDSRFGRAGEDGNARFARNFTSITDRNPPGCGFHTFVHGDTATVETCAPFPTAAVRGLCGTALDADAARRQCEANCVSNEMCRRGRRILPALQMWWNCSSSEEADQGPGPQPPIEYMANCQTQYLCQCTEQ